MTTLGSSVAGFPTVPGEVAVLSTGRASRLEEANGSGGADTTFRCQGIKRVDQAYFYARTRELTDSVIDPAAAQNGFLVADPAPKFAGREFCGDDQWFIGVVQAHGPTWDKLVVPNPEQGDWTVRMCGADVDPEGEEVLLSVGQQQVANQRPVPAFDLTYDGRTLALDASASRDADGEITTYRWFVDDGETETVAMGIWPGDTSLCMTGVTRDEKSFPGCDGIRQVPRG